MTKNINSITIIITLEGIAKTKTEKKSDKKKQSEEYFFHQLCEKTSTNTVIASRFWLAAYITRLLTGSHFIGSFPRAKLHFSL